jgi:RNA polymerase subunit RPABC4/transcription elongation factor Spt4
MYINKTICTSCFGKGATQEWIGEDCTKGSCILKAKDVTCPVCKGKGYTRYHAFTLEEAIKIAKHFDFEIIGDVVDD